MGKFFIEEHIDRWTKGWNDHDIKSIISMHAKNIEFSSPKMGLLMPEKKATSDNKAMISNKQDLQRYFSIGLAKFPKLRFTPIIFLTEQNMALLEYVCEPYENVKWHVIEKFEFEGELIARSSVFYGPEESKVVID
jgi:hypothetical protein